MNIWYTCKNMEKQKRMCEILLTFVLHATGTIVLWCNPVFYGQWSQRLMPDICISSLVPELRQPQWASWNRCIISTCLHFVTKGSVQNSRWILLFVNKENKQTNNSAWTALIFFQLICRLVFACSVFFLSWSPSTSDRLSI